VNGEDDITARIRPRRRITAMSAVLIPYAPDGAIDWPSFEAHVARTREAGLTPAVNMDTGYVQLLDPVDRERVLDLAKSVTGGDFVAGAYVSDQPGARFDLDASVAEATAIAARGGTPVIFPSHGLHALPEPEWVDAHVAIGERVDRFLAFELGPMFVAAGRIVSLDAYRGLLDIPTCAGAKHSSLSRALEWDRLALRDEVRPDFLVLTGNDLAIDMVMYGSDYLLGLSTFAPAAFARRDGCWAAGDPAFFELNDVLQALGAFTFRNPVPGYRHDAAMWFARRGWAAGDFTPPGASRRPGSDDEVLATLMARLDAIS